MTTDESSTGIGFKVGQVYITKKTDAVPWQDGTVVLSEDGEGYDSTFCNFCFSISCDIDSDPSDLETIGDLELAEYTIEDYDRFYCGKKRGGQQELNTTFERIDDLVRTLLENHRDHLKGCNSESENLWLKRQLKLLPQLDHFLEQFNVLTLDVIWLET